MLYDSTNHTRRSLRQCITVCMHGDVISRPPFSGCQPTEIELRQLHTNDMHVVHYNDTLLNIRLYQVAFYDTIDTL